MSHRSAMEQRTDKLRSQGIAVGLMDQPLSNWPRDVKAPAQKNASSEIEGKPESCAACGLHCIDYCLLTVNGPPQKLIEAYITDGKLSISPHWQDYIITARQKHPVYGTAFTIVFNGKKSGMPPYRFMKNAIGTSVNNGGQ